MNKRYLCAFLLALLLCGVRVEAKSIDVKVKNQYNVSYNNKSKVQKLDIYYPKKIKKNNDNSVVVYFHGGSYQGGSKKQYAYKNKVNFNKEGIIFVSVNYRTSKYKKFPAAVDDAKTSIRFLKANYKKYKINPNKVVVMGHSAGANLASLVASTPNIKKFGNEKVKYARYNNSVAGLISVAGYYDTYSFINNPLKNNSGIISKIKKYYYRKNKKIYNLNLKKGNVVRYANGLKKPVLIMSGKKDGYISYKESENYCNLLKGKGKKVECITNDRGSHALTHFQDGKNFSIMINFVKKVTR